MAARKKPAASTSKALINYDEQIAQELAALGDKIAPPSGDKIKLRKDGSIELPDGSSGTTVECVILDFISVNSYYDRPYDADEIIPPACFAIGANPKLMEPSGNSPDAQSKDCASCPMNQFGSAPNGKGKACRNSRLVAVTPAASLELEADEPAPVYILSVPPTSLKSFDGYVRDLALKHKTIPLGVLTELYQDEGSEYVAPRFNAVRPLTGEEKALIFPHREAATKRLTAEPDVSGYEPPRTRGNAKPASRKR